MRITVIFSSLFLAIAGVEREVLDVAEDTTIDQLSSILAHLIVCRRIRNASTTIQQREVAK